MSSIVGVTRQLRLSQVFVAAQAVRKTKAISWLLSECFVSKLQPRVTFLHSITSAATAEYLIQASLHVHLREGELNTLPVSGDILSEKSASLLR